jgi:hypothetical protein
MKIAAGAPAVTVESKIIVAEFTTNRSGGLLRVLLCPHFSRVMIDLQKRDGPEAIGKNISFDVAKLPAFAAAVTRALAKAREPELIDGND